ncbi:WXG100 family type VII secretion target [Kutzneria sp. NPDC052558]|uniref:WXG100 family type VII secretion target n=1 Tax=Kutzneria sp. NPDC052558 TaxID=3364121 RepID=UPI0037C8AAB7
MTGHPAVPHPNANYPGMSHDQIKTLVTQNVDPGAAYKAGDEWHGLAGQLRDAAITLDAAINGSQSHWEGAAADLARAHLAKVRDWSADTAQYFNATGTAMHDQVDAAAKAKADMPDPIEYNPGKMLAQAAVNPIALIALPAEMYLTHEASNDAKNKAVQVIQARDSSMQSASSSIPAFTPPPDLSGGSTASTQLASAGPVGAGGGVSAYQGTSGGGASYGGSHYTPSTSGGGYTPAGVTPGGSGYTPNQVGGPGSSTTRLAGYDPGMGGPGYNGPNYTNTPGGGGPNSPYGPGGGPAIGLAGGAGGGAGGGGSYRGGAAGAGSSSSSASTKPGMGSSAGAGAAGEGGSGARGGMGASGSAGNSGMGAGGAGQGGKKEEDKERKRPTFLVETDDVFGDGQMVAPTVIGENPSGGY